MSHQSVLLHESVTALITDAGGYYVDGTFGRGGHSQAILNGLNENGRLLAIDKDIEACEYSERYLAADGRFSMVHGAFSELKSICEARGLLGKIAGILLDLGVSSPQLDEHERGFSFLRDGPLDMRMDNTKGLSAATWLAEVDEKTLARVLQEYGEERFAKLIARAIVQQRKATPLETTHQLAQLITDAIPCREKHKHPATRSFQAIRIFINDELGDLQTLLDDSLAILKPGGRLCVISFHSLEDAMVKRFIRYHERGGAVPSKLPLRECEIPRPLKQLGKAIRPCKDETADNVRARSAILRVAERQA